MAGIVRNGNWYSGVQTPATSSALGLVKPDSSTIAVDANGTISANKATSSAPGIVKPDNASTSVTAQGVISGKDFGYAECSTARNVLAKVVTLSGFSLQLGAHLHIRFTDTTTSNPASGTFTLNVNGTGALPIVDGKSNKTQMAASSGGHFYNNQVCEFVYDGTNWVYTNRDNNSTYSPQTLGFGYGTCTTAASTADKVATLANYALVAHGIVAINFTNAVPANATLDINSRGAKNILFHGARIKAGVINAGDTAVFIYDGTQYRLLTIDSLITTAARSLIVETANP